MSALQQEDLDIEQDVTRLKKVWNDIKEPKIRSTKPLQSTQNATQTRISKNDVQANQSKKQTRVVVSEENMKKTVRNPKSKPEEVIEIVTQPHPARSDSTNKQGNRQAPELLFFTNPEKQNLAQTQELKQQLAEKDYELSLLRVSNSHNEDKVKRLEAVLEQRDTTIEELRARERELTQRLAQMDSKDLNFNYGKVQYENYRHDSRRLLKMLKNTQEYGQFADLALEDGGVRYLGGLKNVKTKLDTPDNKLQFHFCTCNKDFIPQPLVWVPEKAYQYGKDFVKERKGQLMGAELDLLLYQLNKIWREREKRIINHVYALKGHEVAKYKRKLQGQGEDKEKRATQMRQ